jgi:hypothetical protein
MREVLSLLLVFIGLVQSIGYITQQPWLKSIGIMTVSSPLPIVFTEQKGLETFANDFFLEYEEKEGKKQSIQLTSTLYKKLNAPYNYRNVLGAVISYGPILPEAVVDSVLEHSFQNPGNISLALGLEVPLKNASIIIKTKTKDKHETYVVKIKKGEK